MNHHCHNYDYSKPVSHPEFAEVSSVSSQSLAASKGVGLFGGACHLEQTVVASAFIDVSLAAAEGKVVVNKAGWFSVQANISAIPDASLGLLLNGAALLSGLNEYVHCNAGDYLQLVNVSLADIQLNPAPASIPVANRAQFKIVMLRADLLG
jgi:hypothetical protein